MFPSESSYQGYKSFIDPAFSVRSSPPLPIPASPILPKQISRRSQKQLKAALRLNPSSILYPLEVYVDYHRYGQVRYASLSARLTDVFSVKARVSVQGGFDACERRIRPPSEFMSNTDVENGKGARTLFTPILLCTPSTPNEAPKPTRIVAIPNAPREYSGPSRSNVKGLTPGLGFALELPSVRDVPCTGVTEIFELARRGGTVGVVTSGEVNFALPLGADLAACVDAVRRTGGAVVERCFESPRARFCRQSNAAGTVSATVVRAN